VVQFTRVLGHPLHLSFDEDVTSASLWLMSAPKLLPLAPALVFFAVTSLAGWLAIAGFPPRAGALEAYASQRNLML
jgi:hypothetical protein